MNNEQIARKYPPSHHAVKRVFLYVYPACGC
jgi:hypothetical protein